MSTPIPALRRFVLYTLSAADAKQANGQRETAIWRRGNIAAEGDVYPMLIVRCWGVDEPEVDADKLAQQLVNGQVFLDGNDTLWVTSVKVGEGPGTFSWGDRA